ncbi:MAG TPA: adenine methyltransferase, partial [Thermoanaerobaculia bacterium]
MLAEYLRALVEQERRGDAREESHYPALKALLERAAAEGGRPDVRVTVMPRRTLAGDVDFQVWAGGGRLVGYLEAKRPGTSLAIA